MYCICAFFYFFFIIREESFDFYGTRMKWSIPPFSFAKILILDFFSAATAANLFLWIFNFKTNFFKGHQSCTFFHTGTDLGFLFYKNSGPAFLFQILSYPQKIKWLLSYAIHLYTYLSPVHVPSKDFKSQSQFVSTWPLLR